MVERVFNTLLGSRRRGKRHVQATSIYDVIQEPLARVELRLSGLARSASEEMSGLIDHVLETGGKRLRPAITLLASGFHQNNGSKSETMAVAVELLHIATLIHDDTVDNSDIRRGAATASNLWGRNVAVLLGDYVFATSATYVCDTGDIRVIRRFSETIMELSAGELSELAGTYDWRVTRQQYMDRIYKKTASLFTTAGESGAILSGAPEDVVVALREYSCNLGMAFQIMDDILDFEATREDAGKPVGSDLVQGVATLPTIIAIERYPHNNPIVSYFEDPEREEQLSQAVEMVQSSSVLEDAHRIAQDFCATARSCLQKLEPNPHRASLEDLLEYVLTRRG